MPKNSSKPPGGTASQLPLMKWKVAVPSDVSSVTIGAAEVASRQFMPPRHAGHDSSHTELYLEFLQAMAVSDQKLSSGEKKRRRALSRRTSELPYAPGRHKNRITMMAEGWRYLRLGKRRRACTRMYLGQLADSDLLQPSGSARAVSRPQSWRAVTDNRPCAIKGGLPDVGTVELGRQDADTGVSARGGCVCDGEFGVSDAAQTG